MRSASEDRFRLASRAPRMPMPCSRKPADDFHHIILGAHVHAARGSRSAPAPSAGGQPFGEAYLLLVAADRVPSGRSAAGGRMRRRSTWPLAMWRPRSAAAKPGRRSRMRDGDVLEDRLQGRQQHAAPASGTKAMPARRASAVLRRRRRSAYDRRACCPGPNLPNSARASSIWPNP